jgi:hypothetical protein
MYTTVAKTFENNATDVERLIDFDRDVVEIMIHSLEMLKKDVPPQLHSFAGRIDRAATIVSNIRKNDSLKSKYGTVCNQAVVLLVSHFSSAVGDLFRKAVTATLDREGNETLLNEELKLTFKEMQDRNWDLKNSAGDLLIAKKDLTFQDMQSTVRAFDSYVGVEIIRDQCTNNIILGQAARHVIVHTSARATDRMLKQLSKADPRSLKQRIAPDEALVFFKEEVLELKSEMIKFVQKLVTDLESRA